MALDKPKTIVKCQGRFHELREFLYSEVFPIVMDERTLVKEDDLKNTWLVSLGDIQTRGLDRGDPYYASRTDTLRKSPNDDPLSIVPLIESPHYNLEDGLITAYCMNMGINPDVAKKLELISRQQNCLNSLGREAGNVGLMYGENLAGYVLSGNFGIGTIVPGGVSGGGIVSDTPFTIGVSKQNPENRAEFDLAGVMGFWPQGQELIVAQMQLCRNAPLPSKTPQGVTLLRIAECMGTYLGFKEIATYSSKTHPIFQEHPDNRGKLESGFAEFYDTSAKKLKYDGGRVGYHRKILLNSCK